MPVDSKILDNIAGLIKDKDERVSYLVAMLYGNSGAGKTVLAMQIAQQITPPDKEILIIYTSNGWVSIRNHPDLDYRYDPMPFVNRDQVLAVAEGIRDGHPAFAKYGCLILDEFSTMADEDLLGLVEKRAATDKGKDPDEPTWPDRNATDNRIKKMLGGAMGDFHLITTAHEREYKNKQKQSCTGPDFADALRVKVQRPMHFVGHVEAVLLEGEHAKSDEAQFSRFVQCHGSRDVTAKSRVSGLRVHEDFDTLVEKITRWLKAGGKLEPNLIKHDRLPTETAVNTTDNTTDNLID